MSSQNAIAIIGGATAGAEAADVFAAAGILTVVFDQNARPYGKVEDGLPRWHEGLRAKEYAAIDRKLSQEHVHFVPCTNVGKDIDLRELASDWGFQAVVLANGAWNDRPLPIEGADRYVGRGLVYQNPYIQWYNHHHEADYAGEQYEVLDGTIVVGGGLASIDMVKIITMELTLRALSERGIEEKLTALEVKGIPKVLAEHGLTWEELGLEGPTLYYRRRPEDMPLVSIPEGADDKTRARIEKSRARVLAKALDKYKFNLQPLCAPVDLIVEDERLVGIVFARTRIENGRVVLTDERLEARGPQVISSIGSIPRPLEGIPMKGELYAFSDWDMGRLDDYPTLFSAGNVVTGKGNIVDSRKHAKKIAGHMRDEYVKVADKVSAMPGLSDTEIEALLEHVREAQQRVGYDGDYQKWVDASKPPEFV